MLQKFYKDENLLKKKIKKNLNLHIINLKN